MPKVHIPEETLAEAVSSVIFDIVSNYYINRAFTVFITSAIVYLNCIEEQSKEKLNKSAKHDNQ